MRLVVGEDLNENDLCVGGQQRRLKDMEATPALMETSSYPAVGWRFFFANKRSSGSGLLFYVWIQAQRDAQFVFVVLKCLSATQADARLLSLNSIFHLGHTQRSPTITNLR